MQVHAVDLRVRHVAHPLLGLLVVGGEGQAFGHHLDHAAAHPSRLRDRGDRNRERVFFRELMGKAVCRCRGDLETS